MGGRGRPYLSRRKNTLFAPPGTGSTETGHGMCHVAAKICERVLENDTDLPKTGKKIKQPGGEGRAFQLGKN